MRLFRRLTLGLVVAATVLGLSPEQARPMLFPPTPTVAQEPAPARVQPVASPAPIPVPISADVQQLRADLDRLIRGAASGRSTFAVLAVSLDRGDTLFSLNADLPVAPASNMKLFTTAAALYYLGPNFRYSTYALADGPIRNGALDGDIVLYGTGDPAISSRMLTGALSPLRSLADTLLARGIREIRGDVVGDGSYFDDHWIAEGWRDEYRLASYSAPVGALSLAENIVSIRVSPGAAAGEPARITTTPATEGLVVQNRVQTLASGSSSIRFAYDPDGLIIEGRISRSHPGVARTVTVVDPANFAAAAFRAVLENAGIRVLGDVRTVRTTADSSIGRAARSFGDDGDSRPPAKVIGTHLSPTLAEVVTVTNHVSQNLFAESIFKTVGRVALGDGSFGGGARAVQFFLECEKPIDFTNIRIVDGSGLSVINRVTARATIHLLDLMTRTDVWEPFLASLPQAASPQGGSHSLRNRMGGTPAARNLRAKTGTISNVSGLSGYVTAANGELIAFSIYGNDLPSTWRAKRIEDGIGVRLARFTRPEPPSDPMGEAVVGEDSEGSPDESTGGAMNEPVPTGQRVLPEGPAPEPEPAPPAPRTHRVASGETLDGIARRYATTVAEIERMNPTVRPRRLQIGQMIILPAE